MQTCVSCHSDRIRKYAYPEGNILICAVCKIQWSLRKAGYPASDARNHFSHYMDPKSLKEPSTYGPYVRFLKFVKQHVNNNGNTIHLLDVGTGNGIFLKACLGEGFNAIGVDADDTLRNIIPAKIAERIIFKPIDEIEGFDSLFDIITFWDSFEHLPNAFDVLERLKPFLKSNGFVYLRVNNNREIFNYVTGMILRLFPGLGRRLLKRCFGFPGHSWNFSKDGMLGILQNHGWQVIHFSVDETPATRLTASKYMTVAICLGYLVNKSLKSGKIGNYYIRLREEDSLQSVSAAPTNSAFKELEGTYNE